MRYLKRGFAGFLVLFSLLALTACSSGSGFDLADLESGLNTSFTSMDDVDFSDAASTVSESSVVLPDGTELPAWDDTGAFVVVNDGVPFFDEFDKSRTDAFEEYSDLDALGRCGVAYANICPELMPTEKRGEIGSVKPSGWHTIRYNGIVNGNYLYNRCHLIGYQLAGENANKKNLITGTRYLNIDGMLDFENMIADYVHDTGNHVLYRVTPVFDGDDLVARGVLMEAWSVEDSGEGVCFNAFAYNNQPGIVIDYATGDSRLLNAGEDAATVYVTYAANGSSDNSDGDYEVLDTQVFVLNSKSGKFHLDGCEYADSMNENNRVDMEDSVDNMLAAGYSPCGKCHPDEAG